MSAVSVALAWPSVKIDEITSHTAPTRSASVCRFGGSKGIRAARIFDLARVRRRVIVSSDTRKARAICGVESPATIRKVNATCASGARAGWQHPTKSAS